MQQSLHGELVHGPLDDRVHLANLEKDHLYRTYAKLFQQGMPTQTVQTSTARKHNAAGAILRKFYERPTARNTILIHAPSLLASGDGWVRFS